MFIRLLLIAILQIARMENFDGEAQVGDGFFHSLSGTFGVDKRHHVHHLDLRIVQSRHGFHNNLFPQ